MNLKNKSFFIQHGEGLKIKRHKFTVKGSKTVSGKSSTLLDIKLEMY